MWEHARIVARSRRRALGIGGRLLAGLPFWKLLLRGQPASAQVATTTAPFITSVFTVPFSTTAPFLTSVFTVPFSTTVPFVTTVFTVPFSTTVPFVTTVFTVPFSTTAPFTTTVFDTTSPFTTVLFTVPAGGDGGGGSTTDVPEPSSVVMLGSGLAAGAAWFWGRAIKDRVRSLLERLVGDDPD